MCAQNHSQQACVCVYCFYMWTHKFSSELISVWCSCRKRLKRDSIIYDDEGSAEKVQWERMCLTSNGWFIFHKMLRIFQPLSLFYPPLHKHTHTVVLTLFALATSRIQKRTWIFFWSNNSQEVLNPKLLTSEVKLNIVWALLSSTHFYSSTEIKKNITNLEFSF